ncbi:MAG: nucleotidyltransferase family protein [Colwellia sp.]|jgi:Nucleoside-diphosphate-sugar pyrophosphorylase involved in lipopolysaccharide biosynthesis/translation initiation factor 2B, gamma/epsilon subunits (eIF-2Bgamma/eIF-2Bepsilon)
MPELLTRNWNNTLLSATATIADAIKSLNDSMMQIVLVVDEENKLLGTITDGDIRRGLLNGFKLTNSLSEISNKDPLIVSPSMSRDTVLQLMKMNKIHQLPVVDDNQCVVDLHLWDSLLELKLRSNVMIIMAGGKGTRLRPHTENCPKPLLEVGGKPMLEYIIERAKLDGISHFVLAIHYLGYMIEEYFGDGSKWGVKIEYLREEQPLGTAGALSLFQCDTTEPILITNGDVLTDVHYGEIIDFHKFNNASATMAVRQHQWENPFGVVRTQGVDITGFDEKPIVYSHINAGIYVLDPEMLKDLKKNEYCDMPTLFALLKGQNLRTIVYPMHETWMDVGRHDDLKIAQESHAK